MEDIIDRISVFLPLFLTVILYLMVLALADRLLIQKAKLTSHNRPPHQLVMNILS